MENKMINKKIFLSAIISMIAFMFMIGSIYAAQSAVNLGTAGNYVILAKSGVSTTGVTAITGDIGVSPIDSTGITGFGLIKDSSNTFATSSLVTGKIYAADYTSPTDSKLTAAVSDMETAYTDGAGRTETSIVTELGAGNIGGMTLAPGLYKWGTGLTIPTDVTLSGSSTSIWIFQIAGTLDIASATQVKLAGGALAKNVFWIVADTATLGTTSVFNGNILDLKDIVLNTGAVLNGRALAQTAVTLDANAVTAPGTASSSVTPLVNNTNSNSDSNSGSGYSGNSGSDVQINTNSEAGIGQNLSYQIAEKRIEYRSGNFTTSLGQFLNVREISSGLRELREGRVSVETRLDLTKVENKSKSRLDAKLSNGSSSEIKIMPSTASQTALTKLKLNVCSEANNCTIELKEVATNKGTRLAYAMKADKQVKVLGLFRAKMNIETNVDAQTGEIISTKIPWWASISTNDS